MWNSSELHVDAPLNLDLGRRDVRLERLADESLMREGDDLAVAGNTQARAVVCYA